MTDVDDALNRSNPVLHPVEVTADWAELPDPYTPGVGDPWVDDLRDLGQQVGPGGYTVEHSFDDGLPDEVTMTGGNDANGQFQVELVGRQANQADVTTWRTPMTGGSGTGTSITISPNNLSVPDRAVVGVVVIGGGITVEDDQNPEDRHAWKLIGQSIDGSVQLLVYTRIWHAALPLTLTLSASASWVWTGVGVGAETFPPARAVVPVNPGSVVTAIETVNRTGHTIPDVTLDRRGWILSFYATIISIGWTPQGDNTELTENASNPRLMMARSTSIRDAGWVENVVANTASGTDSVAMIAVPLEIMDRASMDAMQYFSPFNADSPIVDFERDTADVSVVQPFISPNGIVDTTIFQGRMTDIKLRGRAAELTAVSKTRVDADKMVTLPVVFGYKEGCTTDWLASWLMARMGQSPGVMPSVYTRQWHSFYGSVHTSSGTNYAFSVGYQYRISNPGLLFARNNLESVPGPYVRGMWAQYKNTVVDEVYITADRVQLPGGAVEFGHEPIPLHTNDILTQANSRGRISFWLRGDPTDPTSAAVVGSPLTWTNTLFRWRALTINAAGDNIYGEINLIILEDRQMQIRCGSTVDGFSTVTLTGNPLPSDGEWHFICMTFDWANEVFSARMDGVTWNPTSWATTTPTNLPVTEEALYSAGGHATSQIRSHLPISELLVEWGSAPFTEGTAQGMWPTYQSPHGTALFRGTNQYLEAIAGQEPVQVWSTLAELAQSTLSYYRTDEEDNVNFLAPEYFGEPAQMTPTVVADTELNAGELNVIQDPTKVRNVVTLTYPETRADTKMSAVASITSAIEIPRGISELVIPTDEIIVEVHGAASPYTGTSWDLARLTSGQITTPSTIPTNVHYMTVNTAADGGGTVWTASSLSARIVGWDASTIIVRFVNSYTQSLYLANNGSDVPVLRLLGYALRVNETYVMHRDVFTGGNRRERALPASVQWVQRRQEAAQVASQLVDMLSHPRAEVTVELMGDPRRKPGQLVELKDSQGTQAQGWWRILSLVHNGNAAQYTQTAKLARVWPTAIWDGPDGWDLSSWGE
jgi:hypothetical protein